MATEQQIEYASDFVSCIEHIKETKGKAPRWATQCNIGYARRCYAKINEIKSIVVGTSLKELNALEKEFNWEETKIN
ncbi:MAG: hypothetical protein PVJ67_01270 [Candidatus Pacearchaeota archaeon]|jgi:hypothetical protein